MVNVVNIHWQDIIIPFTSAFAGAYFAYKFNTCSENKKYEEEKFKQFNVLMNQINVAWMALLNYKIVYLSKVENLIKEDIQKAVQETIFPPNVIFATDIEKNIFLAKYNFQFLLLISETKKMALLTQNTIIKYQEYCNGNKTLYETNGSLDVDTIKVGIEMFELVKDYTDKTIVYLLLLRKKLLECKNRYFKFLYSDKRDIYINHYFDYLIPDINQFQEIVNFSKIIEQSWVRQPNLLDYLKLYKDKIFFKFSSFLKFIGINNK